MKKISSLLLLMTMITFIACNQSGTNSNTNDSSVVASAESVGLSSNDESAVAAVVDSLNKGILDPGKTLLESIASDGLSYGHSGGKIQNKTEFVDDLINGTFDFLEVNISDQTISISGDNAIVRHNFRAKATNSGSPTDVSLGILLVWRKEKGEWKLLARQAFKL